MSKQPENTQGKKPTAKEQREARMKAALRANLQKRKGQARVRAASETEPDGQSKD